MECTPICSPRTKSLRAIWRASRKPPGKSLELRGTWGRIYLVWIPLQRDDRNALDDLEAGIEATHRIGAVRFGPFHLGLLAEAQS